VSTPGSSANTTQAGAAGSAAATTQAQAQPLDAAVGSGPVASATSSAQIADTPAASAPRQPVDLQDAVDAVRANVTMAVRQGAAEARIALSPASLGTIRISLSQTSDGLVARVVADHPEAARTLLESSGELRSSLQASGLNLVRLDISSSGQQGSQPDASQQASDRRDSAGDQASTDSADDEDADRSQSASVNPLQSGNGLIVDVLA
jgi:flagellar hook-length control protein FliK